HQQLVLDHVQRERAVREVVERRGERRGEREPPEGKAQRLRRTDAAPAARGLPQHEEAARVEQRGRAEDQLKQGEITQLGYHIAAMTSAESAPDAVASPARKCRTSALC